MYHIIGASGFIGTKLIEFFNQKGIADYIGYSDEAIKDFKKLDLLNIDYQLFDYINEDDVVVFLAAISSPDICENNYQFARSVNVVGTESFIAECLKREAKVIFFSSDVVYGGNEGINTELTSPNPIGKYAEMKLYIEENFKSYVNFKVLRLSYVLSEKDKFLNYLTECYKKNQVAEVFDGLFRNVIMVEDVLDSIYNLSIRFSEFSNWVFNICGEDCLSRVDLTKYYTRKFNNIKYKIIEVPVEILNSRPNKIEVKSLYLDRLLNRKTIKIKSCEGDKK
jgi:dTDP-4-dehydrorhamnose reductase